MARLDGLKASFEVSLEVAKLAAAAAYRAPQMTGRLELRSEIVTGDDLAPIVEFFEAIVPASPVMRFDFHSYKYFLDQGNPPPILFLGTDFTRSDLGWDCGACGFETCAKFNAYSKKNKSEGALATGPACNWKLMDFSMACDFACAAVSQYRFETRAMGTLGMAAAAVGYLAGCSMVLGIPVGPAGDLLYFSRSQNLETTTQEDQRQWLIQSSLVHWLGFPGNTKPNLKTSQEWWKNLEYPAWGPLSEEEQGIRAEAGMNAIQVSQKYTPKIAGLYDKKGRLKEK